MQFRDHINFRDLGEYITEDGRHIKPGLLFRSGGLYLMNEEEREYFLSLGIKCIMDLRTTEESTVRPDPVFPGIEMIQYSGLSFANGDEIDFSPIGMSKIGKEGIEQLALLTDYYNRIPFGNPAFKILMEKIVSGVAPIVFHCYTGKDRTGVFAIILLLALGVDEETVFNDYMLSNHYHREAIERAMMDNAEKIEKHPEAKELLTMWFGVSEKIGLSIISEINTKYGSKEKYLETEFGLNAEALDALRTRYLE